MLEQTRRILFIEDDPDDVLLIQLACKNLSLQASSVFAANGQEAVAFLKKPLAELETLPALIFLDLNMPLMNGFEFLKWIRNEASFAHIPVVVLSTSTNPRDIAQAYKSGANAYVSKPATVGELGDLLATSHKFWLSFVRFAPFED